MGFGQIFQLFGKLFRLFGKLFQILENESKPFLCKQTKTIPKAIIAPNSAAVMSNSYFTFQNAIKALSRAQRTVHSDHRSRILNPEVRGALAWLTTRTVIKIEPLASVPKFFRTKPKLNERGFSWRYLYSFDWVQYHCEKHPARTNRNIERAKL